MISIGTDSDCGFCQGGDLQLSALKMNCFTLYTESVFKTESHPDVAPIDGFTAAEITDIEEFAALHFVEMIPNQQMFGHMEKMLRNPFIEQQEMISTF